MASPVRALQALVAERGKSRSRLQTQGEPNDLSKSPIKYDPKTLAVMDQAFAAIWHVLRTDDRDYANDSELRIAIGQ